MRSIETLFTLAVHALCLPRGREGVVVGAVPVVLSAPVPIILREGETVLDLGSGTGKICFIASQVVGPEGSVIGVG